MPFSFTYDSGSAIHLEAADLGATWDTNDGYLSQGGWAYSVPVASYNNWYYSGNASGGSILYACYYSNAFMFTDAAGGRHSLPLTVGDSSQSGGGTYPGCVPNNSSFTPYIANNAEVWFGQKGGDAQVYGILACTNPRPGLCTDQTLKVSDASGTVYSFGGFTQHLENTPGYTNRHTGYALAGSIEDHNGNVINATGSTTAPYGTFAYKDTLGRDLIASSGFGSAGDINTVTLGGVAYKVKWRQTQASYTIGSLQVNPVKDVSCSFPSTTTVPLTSPAVTSIPLTVVDSITLPNGTAYQFYYGDNNPSGLTNPYGLLSEIVYPDGGWVKYTWGLPSDVHGTPVLNEIVDFNGMLKSSGGSPYTDGCQFQHQTPVVLSRTVGYGGTSATALTQTFSYQVSWNPNSSTGYPYTPPNTSWSFKTTTITDSDPLYGKKKTIYTYASVPAPGTSYSTSTFVGQIPVEQVAQYYDWGDSVLPIQTTTKAWLDQYTLSSETRTLGGSASSRTDYCYVGQACWSGTLKINGASISQMQERDEYDFGSVFPVRRTVTTYQGFAGAPGVIADKACKQIVYGADGKPFSETDSYYDGGIALCVEPSSPIALAAVNGLPQYDLGYGTITTHDEVAFGATSSLPRGNLSKKVTVGAVLSPTTTFTYDETGQIVTTTDACGNASCADIVGAGHTTAYVYSDSPSGSNAAGNSNAYVTQVTLPSTGTTHILKYQYDYVLGQLSESHDENDKVTNYSYNDPLLRLSDIFGPVSPQNNGFRPHTSNVYVDGIGASLTITDPTGVTTRKLYDGMGRVVQTQLASDPHPVFTDTTYDGMGRVYSQTTPYRTGDSIATTIFGYDGLGRKTLQVQPDNVTSTAVINGTTQTIYSSAQRWSYPGSQTAFTDELGHSWTRTSDALGRLTNVSEPNGASTGYAYDTLDNLKSVTQSGMSGDTVHTRSFNFDSLSRLLTSINPETGATCYGTWTGPTTDVKNCAGGYDGNGNLQYKTDARGVTTNFSYDALNRLLSKTYTNDASGASASCYQYDTLDGSASGANLIGRLTAEWTQKLASGAGCPATKPANAMTSRTLSAYDAMGRIASETQCVGGSCTKDYSTSPTYTYDLAGNLTLYGNLIGTAQFTNGYDAAGRLSSVADAWTGAAQVAPLYPVTLFSSPTYAPFGGLSGATYGTSLNLIRTYDSRLRVTGEMDKGSPGSGPAVPGKAVISIMGGVQAK